ncbi:hypothetical protein [Candidatus Binatus sp.]|jgi:hypothetical protein|uniref:hypothetical protein n=1 Tax=Candidatus Binatus sp. TaxID=2811406 RepID=UPI003BCC40E5
MAVTYPAAIWPAAMTLAIALAGLQGCTAMAPQYVAQNYAPPYYEGGYSTLTPQQKFQLEDHLANQSNQAWTTTAQVMSGAGRLLGGTGSLLGAIRAMEKPSAGGPARVRNTRKSRWLAVR